MHKQQSPEKLTTFSLLCKIDSDYFKFSSMNYRPIYRKIYKFALEFNHRNH